MAHEAGMHEAGSMAKSDLIAPSGAIVVREELLRAEPALVEQCTRATLKGLRFALERRAATIPIITRSIKIKDDLATKGYDAARPALTDDGTFSEESQKKAVEAVLRFAGAKKPTVIDRFFDFAVTKKIASELQAKKWKP